MKEKYAKQLDSPTDVTEISDNDWNSLDETLGTEGGEKAAVAGTVTTTPPAGPEHSAEQNGSASTALTNMHVNFQINVFPPSPSGNDSG